MRKLLHQLLSSPFIGLGIDEPTDRSQEKHISTVVRYVDCNDIKIKTTFLKTSRITSGAAPAIVEAVQKIMADFNILSTIYQHVNTVTHLIDSKSLKFGGCVTCN